MVEQSCLGMDALECQTLVMMRRHCPLEYSAARSLSPLRVRCLPAHVNPIYKEVGVTRSAAEGRVRRVWVVQAQMKHGSRDVCGMRLHFNTFASTLDQPHFTLHSNHRASRHSHISHKHTCWTATWPMRRSPTRRPSKRQRKTCLRSSISSRRQQPSTTL